MTRTFDEYLAEADSTPFLGWGFGYITETRRMVEAPLKWNYHNVVLPWMREAQAVLDLGTGGGEIYARFAPLPSTAHATEQYPPNVSIARDRLEPLGVKVVQISERYANNEVLSFDDSSFDLIIDRHESYHPPELMRILRPQGVFITQQVGQGLYALVKTLTGIQKPVTNWNLKTLVSGLESADFEIIQAAEDVQHTRFYDIGAIAYYLKAIPWIIEDAIGVQDFSTKKYESQLWDLHLQIEKDRFYDCSYTMFLIVAKA